MNANIPSGSPAGDYIERNSVNRYKRQRDNRYDNQKLTIELRVQWMRDQIRRDIEFFEAKQTDWLGLEANEAWRGSQNPDATRAKINTAKHMLNDILFRLNRMLSKNQPWNKADLKETKPPSTPQSR